MCNRRDSEQLDNNNDALRNMMQHQNPLVVLALALLFAGCAQQVAVFRSGTPCDTGAFRVLDDFAGARRGRCAVIAQDEVILSIRPEDDGYINDSPWFAFQLSAPAPVEANIVLRYFGGHHRYVPKLSTDGIHWRAIDSSKVEISADGQRATFTVPIAGADIWVSAQELITPPIYEAWNRKQDAETSAHLSVLGLSRGGLPISMLRSGDEHKDVLFLVGRQHPPEVSGAFAFFSFFEALHDDTELARQFRDRFGIVAIPMLNPDGIVGGNWRHNLNGTDLNRDWGPFREPETRLIKTLLDTLDEEGRQPRVFLDFHSTQRNVFYTQDEDSETQPPRFTRRWLDKARSRIENYEFDNDENPTDRIGVSKNYIYHRYGIPASTYEVGDETDRAAAQAAAAVFAEELMMLMLAEEY